jgi:uncharacterized membrane protein
MKAPRAEELSRQLRRGKGPFMARRRAIIALSLAVGALNATIALYQTGIVEHLPDPPLPRFDSEKVDASRQAYSYFNMPDGIVGLGSYVATMGLAAMGGQGRAGQQPWIPLALAAKVGFDAAFAGKLTIDQWTKHRAFCTYCLLAAAATFATVPLVIPEARAALRTLAAGPS